jgi:hypothetical protein
MNHAAMLKRFARYESLRDALRRGLDAVPARCLDDAADRDVVLDALVDAVSVSADARFLRELLGADPGDRMTRMHAHGALLSRATEAAWRLAGGE